ncbi:MAG: carboxypeptidase-like regulatory domain-containing protein [Thermoanaerobaculia bacterium]|nr:carboxypeptidase-like regulatory domain-containing protein [Thermoanaerobaculia bacterium]
MQLGIGLDLVWSYRYATFVSGGGYQSGDFGRQRPYEGPGRPLDRPFASYTREVCIAVWKTSDPAEIRRIWVTLEPWTGALSRVVSNPSDESRAAPPGAWTGERGVACFPGVAPGRYLARATFDGFWDSAVGPIEVPVEDFDVRDVRVGIDLQWAVDDLANVCQDLTWP